MRRPRIVRIRRQPDRRPHIQIQPFFAAKTAGPQRIAQPSRHHQRLIFSRLRQQHHKLVSAVTKRKINQPQLRLDQISNLRQQLAPNQMPVRVVDRL